MKIIFLGLLISNLSLFSSDQYEVLITIARSDALKKRADAWGCDVYYKSPINILLSRRFENRDLAKSFIYSLNQINKRHPAPFHINQMIQIIKPIEAEIAAITDLGSVDNIYIQQIRKVKDQTSPLP